MSFSADPASSALPNSWLTTALRLMSPLQFSRRLASVSMAVLLLGLATSQAEPSLTLIERGQGRAVIVLGSNPSAQARDAATELQNILQRMTGARLPVTTNVVSVGRDIRILLGQSAAQDEAQRLGLTIPSGLTPRFDEEGFVIATGKDFLLLAGNEIEPYQGAFFAVSELLHDLGCRWFFPGEFGEVLPQTDTVRVAPQRRLVKPALRVRDVWYSGHLPVTAAQAEEFALWKRRNRFCRAGFWVPGGPFLQNPSDDSTYRLMPKEKYWTAHPEFYALKPDGSRNERFICMSQPGAIQAATDTVVDYFRQHPDHASFGFSPPDEPVLCHCADCQKAMHGGYGGEGYGDVSDPYFRFVFDLAERVGRIEPNRWIITMAYYNRCRPPEGVSGKHQNVLIQLASIQQCNLHSYADTRCWSRRHFRSMLEGWARLSAGQVFYEYDPHDWSHLQRPAWRGRGIAEDLRLLRRLGGWGFSNEGQMAWLSTGLNYYLHGRLAWELNQDPKEIEADFARRFFGPAARPMRQYYQAIEEALRTSTAHYPMGYDPDGPADDVFQFLTRPLLDRCARLLKDAESLATAEPWHRRVAAFRGHYDRLDAANRARAAMVAGNYSEAARQAEAMMTAVKRVNDSALLQDIGPYGGRLAGTNVLKSARSIAEWTDGPKGKLLAVFPPTAQFRTDPNPEGVVQHWYVPDLDAASWKRVRLDAGWQNQGYATPDGQRFKGVGWYRSEVPLPQLPAGPVRLYLPEVKGSAVWVWCNGRFGGYWERSKQGPRDVDLSGLLQPGRNLVVFRVKGEGGLTLPPLLFTPGTPR